MNRSRRKHSVESKKGPIFRPAPASWTVFSFEACVASLTSHETSFWSTWSPRFQAGWVCG